MFARKLIGSNGQSNNANDCHEKGVDCRVVQGILTRKEFLGPNEIVFL